MEGFYDFEPQYSGNRFPTLLELKEIKQMLLTGDRDQILQSAERIKMFLNSQESTSVMLRSDISEFLCDAVIPFDSVIVCTLYNCIEQMTRHVEFFTHNHTCFAIESLIRTLHFIMKDPSNNTGLNQCLSLLNFITHGYNAHDVLPEKKTIENLLQMLPSLITNLSPTANNKYQTGALILSLINLNVIKWNEETSEILLTNLSSWFNLLVESLELEHSLPEKLILLSSNLCYSILRVLVSEENSIDEECNFEVDSNLKNEIIKNVTVFLVNVGTPYFETVPLNSINNDPSQLENFYQAILFFFTGGGTLETNQLTHGLCEMGFLQFTTRIISFIKSGKSQKLRGLCVLALFHVVLYLSEEVFSFPEVWPSGHDDFRREVRQGILQIPLDATQWLDILVTPEASMPSKLALLLYLYFFCMTARSQDMLQTIYPAMVGFIRLIRGLELSVLLLKVVWFVFVMSQLSLDQSSSLESEIEITTEMVVLLEAQSDLSLVYTHHPAFLYWAFSSEINSKMQTKIVCLWLRNKTPDCKELDEMMRTSSDAKFAVLDILQNSWGQELDSAFSSLKSLLMDSAHEDLTAGIWYLLPKILAKFTADSTSVINVDYAIELCSLRTPKNTDITRIIRIASLLPEVLLKSDLISIVPTLSLILELIQLGMNRSDHRVSRSFLRNKGFLLKITEGLQGNVPEISFLSIKIMNFLWKESKEIKNPQKIQFRTETILKLLETNNEQVLWAAVVFIEEVLMCDFQSKTFQITDLNPGFVLILFQEIQNVCIKYSSNVCNRCWSCLKFCLTLKSPGESTRNELISNPLLYEIIKFCLPQLQELHEFQEFLTVWTDLYNSKFNDPCFGRKLFGKFYKETIQTVAHKLINNNIQNETLLRKIQKQLG